MHNALILAKARKTIIYDDITKWMKVLFISAACFAILILSFLLIFAQTPEGGSNVMMAYSNLMATIPLLGWLLMNISGATSFKFNMGNKPVEYNLRKIFFHMPFRHSDYVKELFLSWTKLYLIGAALETVGILVNHICGTNNLKNSGMGIGVIFLSTFTLLFGAKLIVSMYKNEKKIKIIYNILSVLEAIIIVLFGIIKFFHIDKVIESSPVVSFFGSLFGIIVLLIVPVIIYGITKYFTAKYDNQAWLNV